MGDWNLTRATFHANATTSYSVYYQHDWRNRLTRSRDIDATATVRSYDNLDQITQMQTYASSTLDGQYNIITSAGNLRAQTNTSFDNLGQVFRVVEHQVSGSGSLGSTYTTNYWRDGRGNVIKSAGPSGLFSKNQFDGVENLVASFTSFDADETTYADADDVADDTVIEQRRWWYDRNGNEVASAFYRRFDDDTSSTGELTADDSYATGSVNWHDKADRLTHWAFVGHETGTGTRYLFATDGTLRDADGDGVPTVAEDSPLLPNSSDDYIAAKYDYNAAGLLYRTTDNKGHIAQTRPQLFVVIFSGIPEDGQ